MSIDAEQALRRAVSLHRAGELQEAERLYRAVLQANPRHGYGWMSLGALLGSQGRAAEALPVLVKSAELLPSEPDAQGNLGNALRELGRLPEAELRFRRVLELRPDDVEAHGNLASVLRDLGRMPEAEAVARSMCQRWPRDGSGWMLLGALLGSEGRPAEALPVLEKSVALQPSDSVAHNNLGSALHDLGRWPEAEASFRRALELDPDYCEARNNLGNLMMDLGRPSDAQAGIRRALELNPDFSEAHCNLGRVLRALGHPPEAEASFRCALELQPGLSEGHNNLGSLLHELGRYAEAEAHYRRALDLRPDFHEADNNLGNLLHDLRRLADAEARYRRALEIKPDFHGAHGNLANVLHELGRLGEAEASFRHALEIRPDFHEAHSNLANALRDLGRFSEAEASCRRALELKPDFSDAQSNLLFLMAYSGVGTPEDYLARAMQWEIAAVAPEARAAARMKSFARSSRNERPLRIGYVSGDLASHVVSLNIESVLGAHDHRRIEVFAFPTSGLRDAVTERIRRNVDHWLPLLGLSDEAAVDLISGQQIDVLVDLSGHTAHNRLGVFARRAAPIQCHYLGYFASTGITEIDYWIGDAVLIPEAHDRHFSETVWRLPRVWISYAAPAQSPDPVWQPAEGGKVCLGSFNQLAKITQRTVRLWAKVLHRIPNGYLLLKTRQLDEPANRSSILAAFARHGIPATRIELLGRTADPAAHLSLYCRLDVALDPVGGITGGITTSEALWMGTPVVTLAGPRAGERLTTAILAGIGHEDWTARDEDDYVEKVAQLAANPALRQALRHSLRPAMRASPFYDPAGMARALEDAFESMFDRWSGNANHRQQSAIRGN